MGARLAALLGARDGRRWLSLRPGADTGPYPPGVRSACGVLHRVAAGPRAGAHAPDRRAVGRSLRRLPARALLRALDGVERPLPRRSATLLAVRRRGTRHRSR